MENGKTPDNRAMVHVLPKEKAESGAEKTAEYKEFIAEGQKCQEYRQSRRMKMRRE